MATSTTTPRAGLPQWKAEDKVKFITDVSKAFADIDKSFALSGDALIPCTATYDSATKRHTLVPTQASITLPEVFTVRFIATASFTAGDKIYIGGKEYTPAYTDGTQAVQTGTWVIDAAVGVTCVKTIAKAFVGAGSISQFAKIDEEIASLKDTKADKVLTLSDIGISNLPTSMIQIIEAMPDGSSLQYTPAAIHVEGVFPSNSGTLYINRINSLRVNAHFFVSGISKAYFGQYRQDAGWAGWQEIPTMESGAFAPIVKVDGSVIAVTSNQCKWDKNGNTTLVAAIFSLTGSFPVGAVTVEGLPVAEHVGALVTITHTSGTMCCAAVMQKTTTAWLHKLDGTGAASLAGLVNPTIRFSLEVRV